MPYGQNLPWRAALRSSSRMASPYLHPPRIKICPQGRASSTCWQRFDFRSSPPSSARPFSSSSAKKKEKPPTAINDPEDEAGETAKDKDEGKKDDKVNSEHRENSTEVKNKPVDPSPIPTAASSSSS